MERSLSGRRCVSESTLLQRASVAGCVFCCASAINALGHEFPPN